MIPGKLKLFYMAWALFHPELIEHYLEEHPELRMWIEATQDDDEEETEPIEGEAR